MENSIVKCLLRHENMRNQSLHNYGVKRWCVATHFEKNFQTALNFGQNQHTLKIIFKVR